MQNGIERTPETVSRPKARPRALDSPTHHREARATAAGAGRLSTTSAQLGGYDMRLLQRQAGNAAVGSIVQRDPPTEAVETPAQVTTELEARFNGNYAVAAQAVQRLWDSVGGIVDRQQQAVRDFTGPGGAETDAQPSMGEDLVVQALEVALGLALGGIGGLITARAAKTVRAVALAGAIQGEVSGAVPAELVGAAAHLANTYISKTVDAGKSKAISFISSGVRGNLPQATPLAQFGRGQEDTLNEVAIQQGEELLAQLNDAPVAERWIVAQGLYDALRESLQDVYKMQRDSMTDTWFTSQIDTVGAGARPGVLNIELESVYADHTGGLRVSDGNLLGAGSNDAVRGWVADRPLSQIGIPKVVRVHGSLGWGIADCSADIHLWAPPPPAGGPTIRAAGSDPLGAYMGGTEQRITSLQWNRWGQAWLAAYHLGLQDLDNDDPRVSADNVAAGAVKVWDNVKNRSIRDMGGSIGASSW